MWHRGGDDAGAGGELRSACFVPLARVDVEFEAGRLPAANILHFRIAPAARSSIDLSRSV